MDHDDRPGRSCRRKALLAATVVAITVTAAGVPGAVPSVSAATARHDPIHIEGDADLEAQASAEGWPGDGTPEDPYVIAGYDIHPAEGGDGIDIRNTTLHLEIRDNFLKGAGAGGSGVFLGNATNVTVRANEAITFGYGIRVQGSTGIVVKGNEVARHRSYGLALLGSDDSRVEGNEVSLNHQGIRVAGNALYGTYASGNAVAANRVVANDVGIAVARRSDNTTVRGNVVEDNHVGIDIRGASDSRIAANEIAGADSFGISALDAARIAVSDNVVDADGAAVHLSRTDNSTVVDNDLGATSLVHRGIDLIDADDNLVAANAMYRPDTGIRLDDGSQRNVVADHTMTGARYGIVVSESSANVVRNNNLSWTTGGAVLVRQASSNQLLGNDLRFGGAGIDLYRADGNLLAGNEMRYVDRGVDLGDSHDNVVRDNLFNSTSGTAVGLWEADGNRIETNRILQTRDEAVLLYDSANNSIRTNILRDNGVGIELIAASGNSLFDNLFADNGDDVELWDSAKNRWYIEPRPGGNVVGGDLLGGNFWDSYTGADVDDDGLGDVPHRVEGLLTGHVGEVVQGRETLDRHPLMMDRLAVCPLGPPCPT